MKSTVARPWPLPRSFSVPASFFFFFSPSLENQIKNSKHLSDIGRALGRCARTEAADQQVGIFIKNEAGCYLHGSLADENLIIVCVS